MNANNIGGSLKRGWALVGAILAMALIWTVSQAMAAPDDGGTGEGRLVSIYDRGEEHAVLTRGTTVADALHDADIQIDPADIVEPAPSEQLVARNYHVNVYRARPVVVADGAARIRVMTAEQSPRQIARTAGVTLYDEDVTKLERVDDVINDGGAGLKLSIDRAVMFQFTLYGKKFEARTQSATVGEMLREKGITPGPQDGVSTPDSTPMVAGMSISVWRNGKQTITQEEVVTKPIEEIKDADREVGYRAVKTPGTDGKKQVTYEIEMRDGVEVSRKVLASVVTLQPVKQVEVIGAKAVFSGAFGEALARLRQCESGNNYANKNNPKYRGAYQYDYATWANYQGYYDPADAPPAVQDAKAWETYQRRGWQPWPSCRVSQGLQDIYR
jgi:uncharacterized protein YabE (DUF348 family)